MPILMNIANVIVHCLEMCMTCFFFYHVLTPKYSFKKIYSISCLIASIAVLIAYTDYPNILFRQIIIFLSFLILCKNLYKDSFGCILFFICISYTLMTVCDLIITFSLQPKVIQKENFYYLEICYGLLYIHLLFISFLSYGRKKKMYFYLKKSISLSYSLLVSFLLCMLFSTIASCNFYQELIKQELFFVFLEVLSAFMPTLLFFK